jgi:CBS domain-containing protein
LIQIMRVVGAIGALRHAGGASGPIGSCLGDLARTGPDVPLVIVGARSEDHGGQVFTWISRDDGATRIFGTGFSAKWLITHRTATPREGPTMPDNTGATQPMPLVSAADLVNPLLKVADAMTPGPRTCSPASTVLEAALLMRDADCGVVPVTEAGRPIGLLTDRDIALALPNYEANLAGTQVGDIMARQLVMIQRDSTLDSAMEMLGREGVRRVLVVDPDGQIAGILSWTDLVPHLSERGLGRVVSRIVENR